MDVFWCGRPALYFESVQILFMVIAFYAALWLTVMASSANSSVWKFLSVLPAILICCFFFYIVKTAALLRAIYEVDTNALLEVIEETEAADVLAVEVRDSVLQRLEATGEDPFEEINRLYREFDVKGTDALSRREFGLFMEAMGVSFSHKKWEKIYKEVDRNFDNEISLNEFLLFLYPHHDAAVTQENKRLKAISQRVMDRTSILVSHLAPIADLLAQAAAPVRPSFASGEERDEAGPSSAPRSAPPSAPPSGPPPSTSAARRRSVIAHIHPDMVRSRQNSAAGSSFGGAHN